MSGCSGVQVSGYQERSSCRFLNVQVSVCQGAEVLSCQDIRVSGCPHFQVCQDFKGFNCQNIQVPKCKGDHVSVCPCVRVPRCRVSGYLGVGCQDI
jgi:hypothetical protein